MIRIVTDSSSDIPKSIASEYNITIVPLFARFGEEIFRERVDITDEEFYDRLINGKVHPVTIQPNPKDFVDVYEKLSKDADAIVSIHISGKLSGTLNSAYQARDLVSSKTNIELIDSRTVTTGLGSIVIRAAKVAKDGGNLQQVLDATRYAIDNNHSICLLDTLKYLEKGGRIGKAKALIGTLLNVKPLISIKEGEVIPYGQARSRSKGIEQMIEFIKKYKNIEDVYIAYATTPEDADSLAQQLDPVFSKDKIKIFRIGTTLGIHTGPGTLVATVIGN